MGVARLYKKTSELARKDRDLVLCFPWQVWPSSDFTKTQQETDKRQSVLYLHAQWGDEKLSDTFWRAAAFVETWRFNNTRKFWQVDTETAKRRDIERC